MSLKRWCFRAVILLSLLSVKPVQGFMTDSCVIENRISMRQGEMKAVLSEPSWKPELGLGLVPGEEVPKDPRVTNTSTRETMELVAIRLTFVGKDGLTPLTGETMQKVSSLLSIDYEADQEGSLWRRYEGESASDAVQHFYYTQALKRNLFLGESIGESTRPLFTQVGIASSVKNNSFATLQALEGFGMRLEACALEHVLSEEEAPGKAAQAAVEGEFEWDGENFG